MYIHEKPSISQIRVYKDPRGYEEKEPYDSIFTIHYFGDNKVFIEGFKGTTSVKVMREIRDYFVSKGIKEIIYYRGQEEKIVRIS